MTHRIDTVFAAAFAACVVCTAGVTANAQTGSGQQPVHKQATASVQPYYPAPLPQRAWGAPPLQDPRDAYQGYFANPIDNANYSGSGRTTQTLRR